MKGDRFKEDTKLAIRKISFVIMVEQISQGCGGGPTPEIFKVKLDGALSNLIELKMFLLTAKGLNLDDL